MVPAVDETDARAGDEHLHGAGDQDFAGEGGDPGAHLHRQPGDRLAFAFHFPGVQAGPDLDAEFRDRIADGAGAMDFVRGRIRSWGDPAGCGLPGASNTAAPFRADRAMMKS